MVVESGHSEYNKNLFYRAVSEGDLDTVKYMVANGAVLEEKFCESATWHGYLDFLKYLLDNKIKPKDLLYIATKQGHLEIVEYLIDKGFTSEMDLLYAATDNGHLKIVAYLIDNGFAPNDNLIRVAILKGRIEIAKYLIDKTFKPEDIDLRLPEASSTIAKIKKEFISKEDILLIAIEYGLVEFIKYLVEKGFTSQQYLCEIAFWQWRWANCICCCPVEGVVIPSDFYKPFCREIYTEITIYLIEKGFKYSQDLPLRAASGGNLEVLKCLVDKGVELNYNLYKKAAYNGHLHIIEYLPKTCDPRFLLDAAKCGHLHIIEYALKNGIPLNKYIFIKAAKRGHLKIVEFGFATVGQWWRPQFGEIHSMHRDILIAAIKKDRPKIFEYALNNGVSFDEDAIEIAVEEWSLNVLKFACTTRYKDDVCMMVARYGYLDIIEHVYGQ